MTKPLDTITINLSKRNTNKSVLRNQLIDEMEAIELNAFWQGRTLIKLIYDKRLALHKTRFYKLIEKL